MLFLGVVVLAFSNFGAFFYFKQWAFHDMSCKAALWEACKLWISLVPVGMVLSGIGIALNEYY